MNSITRMMGIRHGHDSRPWVSPELQSVLCLAAIPLLGSPTLGKPYKGGPASISTFRSMCCTVIALMSLVLPTHAATFQTNVIEGWSVRVDTRLLTDHKAATDKALQLLSLQLKEIVRVVPATSVAQLRKVPLWFSPEYPGVKPTAEYHPGADWLRVNRRDPAMAKGVEITDVLQFEAEMKRMPNFILHELAHGYHDQFLPGGFDNPEIKAAYQRAQSSGSYDQVERSFGNGRPNTREKAYAMTNPMEYFAETTEAFFSRNDFFPFTRQELKQHDPHMEQLLEQLWKVPKP